MDAIDGEGTFWLASSPEKRVFGRLTFDPQSGARLTTYGTLFEEEEVRSRRLRFDNMPRRILGMLGTRRVTLIGGLCVNRKTEFASSQGSEPHFVEQYSIRCVLQGTHYSSPEIPEFEVLFLKLEYLEAWVNDQLITSSSVESPEGYRMQSTAVPRRASSGTAEFGNVEVSSSVSETLGLFHSSFEQESQMALFFEESQSLEAVLSICSNLRDLLSIAAHKPSNFVEIGLIPSTSDIQRAENLEIEQYTNVFVLDEAARIPHDGESPIPQNMLFTADELGGAGFVAKWCEMANIYKPAVDQLTSLWYSPLAYPEDMFSDAAQSAETLIRIGTGQQNLNLKIELANLAKDAGLTYQNLVGDIDRWSSAIVQTRTNRVVHRGLHENEAIPDWASMTRTLYHLVVVHLLKRCEIAEHQLENISRRLAALQFGQSM